MPATLDPSTARLLPWLIAIAFLMQALDATILNTALPAMGRDLHINPLSMQSVVIAFLLTVALLTPASGWLADRFGSKRVFFGAILTFTAGSLYCALSPNLPMLIVGRVIQGIGGALMMPVGRLVVLRSYPRAELARVMGFIVLPALIGPVTGPALGGWLVEFASWHWIFLINIPIGLLGALAVRRYMPDIYGPRETPFDWLGFVLFSIALIAISLALEGLSHQGTSRVSMLLLLLVGLASMLAYWLRAAHQPYPLFSPKLFHTQSFAVGIFGNLFARLGMGSLPFLLPLLLQLGLGHSASSAGLSMIPMGLAMMASKPLVKPLIDRLGYRRILIGNTLLLGLLIASLSLAGFGLPYPLLLGQLVLIGLVSSLQFTSMNTVTLIDLSDTHASSGNSLLSVVMQVAMSFGVAVAAILLSGFGEATQGNLMPSFQLTCLCVGGLTALSAGIFIQLAPRAEKPARRLDKEHEIEG